MKIAFLIGVSNYLSQNNLPACKNDVEAITDIVKNVANYDEVITFSDKTSSSNILPMLADFVGKYKNETIDELFFYFSGHGLYDENELFYILTDFQEDKKRQTSLQNSEIDNMFKTINPKLMIKIVDACNSGISYIKDGNNCIQKILENSKQQFNNCYFMFSSQKDQSSYIGIDGMYSNFTKSFIKSLVDDNKNSVRYKDIINFVSDEFDNNEAQTPLFINQANFTEEFVNINKDQKEYIKTNLLTLNFNNSENQDNNTNNDIVAEAKFEPTLLDIINEDNKRYIQEEQIFKIFEEIENIYKNHNFSKTLNRLYNIKEQVYKNENQLIKYDIKKIKDIGEWLNDNKHSFFAKPTYTEREYKKTISVPKKGIFGMMSMEYVDKEVIERKRIIEAFETTYDKQPFQAIKLYLNPNNDYQNIKPFDIISIFILSKLELKIFYYYGTYKEHSWNSFLANENIKWKTTTIQLINFFEAKSEIINILNGLENYVIEMLEKEFMETSVK